jgi:hypothetical protein
MSVVSSPLSLCLLFFLASALSLTSANEQPSLTFAMLFHLQCRRLLLLLLLLLLLVLLFCSSCSCSSCFCLEPLFGAVLAYLEAAFENLETIIWKPSLTFLLVFGALY